MREDKTDVDARIKNVKRWTLPPTQTRSSNVVKLSVFVSTFVLLSRMVVDL